MLKLQLPVRGRTSSLPPTTRPCVIANRPKADAAIGANGQGGRPEQLQKTRLSSTLLTNLRKRLIHVDRPFIRALLQCTYGWLRWKGSSSRCRIHLSSTFIPYWPYSTYILLREYRFRASSYLSTASSRRPSRSRTWPCQAIAP